MIFIMLLSVVFSLGFYKTRVYESENISNF